YWFLFEPCDALFQESVLSADTQIVVIQEVLSFDHHPKILIGFLTESVVVSPHRSLIFLYRRYFFERRILSNAKLINRGGKFINRGGKFINSRQDLPL